MNLQVVGDGIEIDEHIKELLDLKVGKELDKFLKDFDEDLKHANIKIEKLARSGFKVNFDMRLPGGGGHIYSEEEGDDLINVLIALRKEVSTQIKDYKDKLQEYRA